MSAQIIEAELYEFVPDSGKRESFLAETAHDAQLYAAKVWHGVPGGIFATGRLYFYPAVPLTANEVQS